MLLYLVKIPNRIQISFLYKLSSSTTTKNNDFLHITTQSIISHNKILLLIQTLTQNYLSKKNTFHSIFKSQPYLQYLPKY